MKLFSAGNAYDLRPLDVNDAADQLKVRKLGKEAGARELPSTDAQSPDQNEREILGQIHAFQAGLTKETSTELRVIEEEISGHQAGLLSETTIQEARNSFTELGFEADSLTRHFETECEKFIATKEHFDAYRAQRNITTFPTKAPHFIDDIAFFGVLIIVEAAANLIFFQEGNEFGMLGAFGIALGLSVLNVMGGFAFGLWFKSINSIFMPRKILGVACAIGVTAFLLLLHGIAAFYRGARIENLDASLDEHLRVSASRLLGADFSQLGVLSVALFVVGSVFGLLSFWKGFRRGHPYPGYEKQYHRYEASRDELISSSEELQHEYLDKLDDITKQLAASLHAVPEKLSLIDRRINQKREIHRRLQEIPRELSNAANSLVTMYRRENVEARKSDAPRYFHSDAAKPQDFQFSPGLLASSDPGVLSRGTRLQESVNAKCTALINEIEAEGKRIRSLLQDNIPK